MTKLLWSFLHFVSVVLFGLFVYTAYDTADMVIYFLTIVFFINSIYSGVNLSQSLKEED